MLLFKDKNPDLLDEYDYVKNDANGLDLKTISASSNKSAFWKCRVCGGSWESTFASRNRYRGCPYCAGKKVLKGYNDLRTRFPDIAKEWDYEKNIILPTEVTSFSMKNVFWKCEKGHSYSMIIANRTSQGQGCPYCAGKKVYPGFNDLESLYPEVAKEWDYEKNSPLLPSDVTYGSTRKVWWKCRSCGNEWFAAIYPRTKGEGCLICGNKRGAEKRIQKILNNGSSFADKAPWLLNEWDYNKNCIDPKQVPFQSHKKYYWICEKGHSYDLSIAQKYNGYGCPYCSGKRVLKGFNDLASHNPELLSDWDYENNTISPEEITFGSKKKVYWKCQNCGKPFQVSVQEKRRRGTKYCQFCRKEIGSSIPEQAVYFYVKQVFPDAINAYRDEEILGKKSLDIFIPSIKTGIEYDGRAWHNDTSRDVKKSESLSTNNIQLIRLRETDTPTIEDGAYVIPVYRNSKKSDYLFLEAPLEALFQLLQKRHGSSIPSINIEQDTPEIISGFLRLQKENSLAECYPDLSKELHPTKNKGLKPEHIGCRSGHIVWWKCPVCGYEWKSRIIDRTTKKQGCKQCKKAIGAIKRASTRGNHVY